jgi:DNA-binding MarR family transcriptional regulator
MVFNHPATAPKVDADPAQGVPEGRLGSHSFFLMLQAVRAYQDQYSPKLETLKLSVIEARILLVLGDLESLPVEGLLPHLNAPINEVREALLNLKERDLIAEDGNLFSTTDQGRAKAADCWDVATSHAEEAFADFTEEQMDTFTHVLRGIIQK